MADRGRKGVTAILRLLWSIGEHSPEIFFKLFDSQIQPILTYGSEIWGVSTKQDCIERVHLSAMKRFLCVSQRTPKHLVYGELGRYPLRINTFVKCVKFWLRILCMDDSRYPKKAYNMLLFLQKQNYSTWACNIRNLLYTYGYGVVWEAQAVGDIKSFIAAFKQRLIDNYAQDWHSALESHTFYGVYSTYSHSLILRPYFNVIKSINIRKIFTRFRLGMLPLRAHFLNFNNANTSFNNSCPFCTNVPETELHFLLTCPKYDHLRTQFISKKYYRQPSLFKLTLLMSSCNKTVILRVCIFVYKAYLVRMNAQFE